MDQFEVGQFVIQTEPISHERWVSNNPWGGTGTMVTTEDRSFMDAPMLIVAVELSFVVVKLLQYGRNRVVLDTRRHKLRVLSPAFVEAWQGQSEAPLG